MLVECIHTYYMYCIYYIYMYTMPAICSTCPTVRPLQKKIGKKIRFFFIIKILLFNRPYPNTYKYKYIYFKYTFWVTSVWFFSNQTTYSTNVCHRRLWEVPCTIHSCSHSQVSRKLREQTKEHNFRFSKFYYKFLKMCHRAGTISIILMLWYS